MEKICRFIKEAGVYFLATTEGDKPKVRPFGTIHIYNHKLYIQTGKSKEVYDQMIENPEVEICALNKDSSEWVRVSGVVKVDNSIEAKKSMLDEYPELQEMYMAEDDNTQVFYFENAEAVFYSFAKEPEIIRI